VVAPHVIGLVGVRDVGRQRHVAVLFEQREHVAGKAQVEQGVLGAAAAQHLGDEAVAGRGVAEMQRGAGARGLAGADVRPALGGRQHALDQHLDAAAAGLGAEQARLDHAGVVEHHQVAFTQQRRQLAEDAIDERRVGAIEQARAAAFGGRVLRDQLGRELEVEVGEPQAAGGRRQVDGIAGHRDVLVGAHALRTTAGPWPRRAACRTCPRPTQRPGSRRTRQPSGRQNGQRGAWRIARLTGTQ